MSAPESLPEALPDPERPFAEPWHAQIFALTHKLALSGYYSWPEWAGRFSRQRAASAAAHASDDEATYYADWLATFEQLLVDKDLAARPALAQLKQAWTQAYLDTPHGKPVHLKGEAGIT